MLELVMLLMEPRLALVDQLEHQSMEPVVQQLEFQFVER